MKILVTSPCTSLQFLRYLYFHRNRVVNPPRRVPSSRFAVVSQKSKTPPLSDKGTRPNYVVLFPSLQTLGEVSGLCLSRTVGPTGRVKLRWRPHSMFADLQTIVAHLP